MLRLRSIAQPVVRRCFAKTAVNASRRSLSVVSSTRQTISAIQQLNTFRIQSRSMASAFKQTYDAAVAERKEQGVVPKPLDAAQVAALVEQLKNPPAGEEKFLLSLLADRVPPGVDEAAYVKAAFLTAVAKGTAKSSIVSPEYATELLGTMQVNPKQTVNSLRMFYYGNKNIK